MRERCGMSTLIAITTLAINYPLERNYDTLLKQGRGRKRFWGVSNSPVPPGRCILETDGLAGVRSRGGEICKRLSTTADFLFFPGLRLNIWRVSSLGWLPGVLWMIGRASMAIVLFFWKRLWINSDSRGPVIRRPTGLTLGRRAGGVGWIEKTGGMVWPPKRFTSTPLPGDSGKSFWPYRSTLWVYLPWPLLNPMVGSNFER